MAAALFAHPFVRRDHENCGFGVCSAGDHVLQELLMTRRIDDHIKTLRAVKIDLGSIDRDVLLLFLCKRIQYVCIFK